MSNYNQTNIYRKQMNKLKLNAKQYAELTGMPYEVVKDILYDKEGDYSMEIKNLLRKNMMNKHQEIENNYETAKFKALELKHENNSMNWYINEYTPELLKETLNLKSRKEFEDKYDIRIDGEPATHWFYVCLTGKKNYNNREIRKAVVEQFAEQLYDILVNGNEINYRKSRKKVAVTHKQETSILKWYNSFDFHKYLKENDMSRADLANACDIKYNTLCPLINKKRKPTYETEQMKKLYNYINNNVSFDSISEAQEQDIVSNTLSKLRQEEQPIFIETRKEPEIEIINNDEIMRKILVSRLTEEEKALIELFGGKIC